jgi:two-component system sensor histidine kinase ChvG
MRLRLLALLVVFAAVPVVLYRFFDTADAEKRVLLLQTIQDQGRIVTAALRPTLENLQRGDLPGIAEILRGIAGERLRVRVFFRHEDLTGVEGFFYVAAEPPIENQTLDTERADLVRTGVLSQIASSCVGDAQLTLLYRSPGGGQEVLTSLTSVKAAAGCFVILTSTEAADAFEVALHRRCGGAPEVRMAAAIYGLMVVVVLSIFLDVWRSLRPSRAWRATSARSAPAGTPSRSATACAS